MLRLLRLVNCFLTLKLIFAFALLIALPVQSREPLKQISPKMSIEDPKIEEFLNSIMLLYLFFADLHKPETQMTNFLFISGENFIEDEKLNLEKMKKYFPKMSEEEAEFFSKGSNTCIIFKLPLSDADVTVGVNSSNQEESSKNLECVLDAIAFFFYGHGYEVLRSKSVRLYGRNIIKELERRSR